jgi:hypothetical protein
VEAIRAVNEHRPRLASDAPIGKVRMLAIWSVARPKAYRDASPLASAGDRLMDANAAAPIPPSELFQHRTLLAACRRRAARRTGVDPRDIKHDGFRIVARRDGRGVRLVTRNGFNFADRFPKIVEAVSSLPVLSCMIDGEAIVAMRTGCRCSSDSATSAMTTPPCFASSIRSSLTARTCDALALKTEKASWRSCCAVPRRASLFNQHYACQGAALFKNACGAGVRRDRVEATWIGLPLRSGRSLAEGQEPGSIEPLCTPAWSAK